MTTAHAAISAAIEQRYDTLFTAADKSYENAPYLPGTNSWTRLSVQFGNPVLMQAGGGARRYVGNIVVQVFIKSGAGPRSAYSLADTLAGIFNEAAFGGVVCEVSGVIKVGERDGWFQLNVVTPFRFDEIGG